MILQIIRRSLSIYVIIVISLDSVVAENGFFNKRYHGWLWYEEKPIDINMDKKQSNDITPSEARLEIESFAKELEELKFMMLARPTVENIKAYKDKEKQMWDKASELHDNWDMANLLYPEQRDLINNPVNVHAVKAKRAMDYEEKKKNITKFAKDFDLVLFFDPDCKYSELFAPVLKGFGEDYGFNIEAVSNGKTKHKYFETKNSKELIENLGITAFPTLIAVSHDSKTAFELIRGYVSISELEEHSVLAIKYLNAQKLGNNQIGNKK